MKIISKNLGNRFFQLWSRFEIRLAFFCFLAHIPFIVFDALFLPDFSKKAGLVNREIFKAINANEGCRILEEGVVSSWKVIDEAILAGMNFLGPMEYATKNYERLAKLLEETAEKLGKPYLKPCDLFKSGKFVDMI